jgi:ABC-type uncharacterized transport system YnjBCD permease subunit
MCALSRSPWCAVGGSSGSVGIWLSALALSLREPNPQSAEFMRELSLRFRLTGISGVAGHWHCLHLGMGVPYFAIFVVGHFVFVLSPW